MLMMSQIKNTNCSQQNSLTTVCVKESKLLFIYTDRIVSGGKNVTN